MRRLPTAASAAETSAKARTLTGGRVAPRPATSGGPMARPRKNVSCADGEGHYSSAPTRLVCPGRVLLRRALRPGSDPGHGRRSESGRGVARFDRRRRPAWRHELPARDMAGGQSGDVARLGTSGVARAGCSLGRRGARPRRRRATATSGRGGRGRSPRTASSPCTARARARLARPGTSPRARGARCR